MPYYFVNVDGFNVSIALLGGAKKAIVECKDENFRGCRICHVDYRAVNDIVQGWGGDPKNWKIQSVFNNLPDSHIFSVGDKVKLKKNFSLNPNVEHVYNHLSHNEIYEITFLHYYQGWGSKACSVVGVENGYGGWIPQDFFELYQEKPTDQSISDEFPGRIADSSPFQVGDLVWMHNYSGSGIPFPLERIEKVQIVPNSCSTDAGGSVTWTHVVKWNNQLNRIDNNRAKFSYLHPNDITPTIPEQYADCYGSHIFAANDGGNGLPKELTNVKIVNPRFIKNDWINGLLSTSKWNHIVEYEGSYYRINTHTATGSVNPCKEVPLPELYPGTNGSAMKVAINSMYGSTGTIASTGTVVTSAAFDFKTYPTTPSESQSKIKALKQQQPIILKTKNHGNERRIKLRNNCIS
jgi:hypothetical protein